MATAASDATATTQLALAQIRLPENVRARLGSCGRARQLDRAAGRVVVRAVEGEDADRAIENITRKGLDPLEEARAVQATSEASDIACYVKPGVI